jgi:hypothetical protein
MARHDRSQSLWVPPKGLLSRGSAHHIGPRPGPIPASVHVSGRWSPSSCSQHRRPALAHAALLRSIRRNHGSTREAASLFKFEQARRQSHRWITVQSLRRLRRGVGVFSVVVTPFDSPCALTIVRVIAKLGAAPEMMFDGADVGSPPLRARGAPRKRESCAQAVCPKVSSGKPHRTRCWRGRDSLGAFPSLPSPRSSWSASWSSVPQR